MGLRFAVSPLWETVAGLRVLAAPGDSPVHQRWVEWAQRRLLDLGEDPSLLQVLVTMLVVSRIALDTVSRTNGAELTLPMVTEPSTFDRICIIVPSRVQVTTTGVNGNATFVNVNIKVAKIDGSRLSTNTYCLNEMS